jgi:tetratricopeptide (TPR) repeat protein
MSNKLFNEAISRGDFIEAYRIAKFVLRDEKRAWDLYVNALDSVGSLIYTAMDLKRSGNYEEAARLFLRCAEFFEGERDYGRAAGFFLEVGDCFSETDNLKKARDSFMRGYELAVLDWRVFDPTKKIASLSVLLSILVTLLSGELPEAKNIFKIVRSSLEEKERRKLRRQDYYKVAKYVYTSLLKENTLNLRDLKNMPAKQEKTDFLTFLQDLSKAYITVKRFLEKIPK